ncbi:fibronectin type III domain-containing protein [Jatrophihabitans fulvus]
MSFDANDYRKRVLAAVHRRGGADASDPFEIYDIPVDEADRWTDGQVAAQLDEVWAFWQRTRDHPKYGTLAGVLVETHEQRCAPLRHAGSRAGLAASVRGAREQQHSARFELLDQAVRRLVSRYRGIPRDKIDGLVEIGALGGLTADEVHARLRHHRIVDAPAAVPAATPAPAVSEHRRQQVRDLLDEFGRLQEMPAPPTLLALLGLDPTADEGEIHRRASSWRARCRELPPSRLRAVADELLVHVRDLLESGPIVLAGYVDAIAADVAAALRPQVRAAVLVEDRLVADDHAHLLGEAVALGLDARRGRRLITGIATELGVEVDPLGEPSSAPARPRETSSPLWEQRLKAARAALREGRLIEARRLATEASVEAGGQGATPIRALADEIADALREAERRWRAAATAVAARRFAEAVGHLEHLCRTATDVPSPTGNARAERELERARRELATADAEVDAALASADPAEALLGVLERFPEHPRAVEALADAPLAAPSAVRAVRDRTGTVVVTWQPSPTPGVSYRVGRTEPGGSVRTVARTSATTVEDGGAPTGAVPVYVVAAFRAGRSSAEVSSGPAAAPATSRPPAVGPTSAPPRPPAPAAAPPPAPRAATLTAPRAVVAARLPDGGVVVRWSGPSGAEYRVARRTPEGREQVVGRTRALEIEDGGAPHGELPVYVVSASRNGIYCGEGSSDAPE